MPLKLRDVRLQAVARSLFPPTTLSRAIAALGFVQADPIAAPARAQDLILRHRVQGYRAGDLERRYPALALEEDMLHVYGYMPRRARALLHPRPGRWQVEEEFPGLAERVLEVLRELGEADHRDLEQALGKMHTQGYWGNRAKATTMILDILHWRGHARIARRQGNLRRYAAAAPADPLPPEARLRGLVRLLAGLYAPVAEPTLRAFVSRARHWVLEAKGGSTLPLVRELVAEGELERAEVDGMAYYWPAGAWREAELPTALRWLAPFDPVVWDRPRFEHLWGWPYRFEAYTPKAKRKMGHYAMPMLWRDRVIGWATTEAQDGQVRVSLGFVGRRPAGRDFKRALEEERARLEAFLGEREVVVMEHD